MYLCKYFLITIIFFSYFIGKQLPPSFSFENSPLEWSQVVILLMGALLTAKWRQEAKATARYHHARFLTWSIPLWLLMAGREMSWGRVFYPLGINPTTGPFFIPVSQLPYAPIVYPTIGVVILLWLFAVMKYKLLAIPYQLFQQGHFPIGEFLLVILAFVVANIAEKVMHFEIMEEIVECVAYLSILLTEYRIKTTLQQSAKVKDEDFF
ncbi:hypothetical protein [Pelosinus sp. IPA-1]|uniref:hypothetical protein n=1 Tax=Pelosinus sp. IPA-1 TaxID=3029569 RepID=UPI00243621E1|nr:hypothetical protein [Pelosinus sp. IPA-1]GMB00060.1 hypothetical protein PIPA1_28590 [Pelosinus sp. IPA-1]